MLINKHICIQLHIQIYIISIPSLWANLPNGSKDFSLGLKLLKVLKAISLSIPSERKFSIHIRDPWTTNPPPLPLPYVIEFLNILKSNWETGQEKCFSAFAFFRGKGYSKFISSTGDPKRNSTLMTFCCL